MSWFLCQTNDKDCFDHTKEDKIISAADIPDDLIHIFLMTTISHRNECPFFPEDYDFSSISWE